MPSAVQSTSGCETCRAFLIKDPATKKRDTWYTNKNVNVTFKKSAPETKSGTTKKKEDSLWRNLHAKREKDPILLVIQEAQQP